MMTTKIAEEKRNCKEARNELYESVNKVYLKSNIPNYSNQEPEQYADSLISLFKLLIEADQKKENENQIIIDSFEIESKN